MQPEIIIQTLRVRDTPVLKENILNHEELLAGQNSRRISHPQRLARNSNDVRRRLSITAVKRGGQRRHVNVRLKLRRRNKHQVLRACERVHSGTVKCRCRVLHLIRSNPERLKCSVNLSLIRLKRIHIRNLHPIESELIIKGLKQLSHTKELRPLVRRSGHGHNLRNHLRETVIRKESPTKHVAVNRDLELLLAVNRVERALGRRRGLSKHVTLKVVALLLINGGLDKVKVNFLDSVTKVHHALLEDRKRVLPRNVTHNGRTDTVNQR